MQFFKLFNIIILKMILPNKVSYIAIYIKNAIKELKLNQNYNRSFKNDQVLTHFSLKMLLFPFWIGCSDTVRSSANFGDYLSVQTSYLYIITGIVASDNQEMSELLSETSFLRGDGDVLGLHCQAVKGPPVPPQLVSYLLRQLPVLPRAKIRVFSFIFSLPGLHIFLPGALLESRQK